MSGPAPSEAGDVQIRRISAQDATHSAFVTSVWWLLRDLVGHGAALGWLTPPSREDVADLLGSIADELPAEACLVAAVDAAVDGPDASAEQPIGIGYWRRYRRPTWRPNADIERVAVARSHQGRGVGRALTRELVESARDAGIEVLTLDLRGDNEAASALYGSLGFVEYGRLPGFVAVGESRYDSVLMALDLR